MRKSTAWLFKVSITVVFVASTMASDADRQSIPFTLEGGHLIVVKGSIGPLEGLNFVIDTGASSVAVSRQVAKKLNLKGVPTEVRTLKKDRLRRVDLPVVKIGAMEFKDISALVAPLTMPGRDRMFRIDALIGLNALRRTSLSIDFVTREIVFGPVQHSDWTFGFYGKLPIVIAPVYVRGQPLRLLLDTGARDLILFQRAVEGQIAMKRIGEKKGNNILDTPTNP